MTTTLQTSAGRVRPRREWGATTPGWLRVATVAITGVTLVTGIAVGVTVVSRSHSVRAARQTAEPLVVDAQTAVVKLSDANATVAGAFLSGPVMPAAAQSRFANDLAQVATSLTAAAERAGTSPRVTTYFQALNTDLPIYTRIIATAEADNRQGQPVGAAYLAEANHFMDTGLLPAASSLYTTELAGLAHDSDRAVSAVPVIVVVVLLAILLTVLLYVQAGLSRRFRRRFNLGGAAATVAVLTLAGWLFLALAAEGSAVSRADRHGTDPLRVLTQARILASASRADDELSLVTRDSDPTYQQDYDSSTVRLTDLMGQARPGWTAAESDTDAAAANVWQGYIQSHAAVRGEDQAGQLAAAVHDDQRISAPQAATMDATLAGGVQVAVASFGAAAGAAQSDLSGLMWASFILTALVVIGVLAGTRPRLREFR